MLLAKNVVLTTTWVFMAAAILAAPAVALEMRSRITDGGVQLEIPGTYWEFSVERGTRQDGPYALIGYRYIGCTEACQYLDLNVEEGETYYYRSLLLEQNGSRTATEVHEVRVPISMGVAASPNPSGGEVTIRFRVLARAARERDVDCTVDVFDASGRSVARAFTGAFGRGDHAVTWNGRDHGGDLVAAGVYFYVVRAGGFAETGRLLRTR
jgi:hypothetical protein